MHKRTHKIAIIIKKASKTDIINAANPSPLFLVTFYVLLVVKLLTLVVALEAEEFKFK